MKNLTLIFCGLAIAVVTQAQIIHVPGANNLTIQEGIDLANPGDTVLVSDGAYYEQISFLGKKPLMVASQLLLDGDTNHINNTIIDGSLLTDVDNASIVLFTSGEDTTSILCGFTIQGGRGTWDSDLNNRCGGGIFISGSGANISHNKITANTVDDTQPGNGQETYGGGIGTSHEDADYWIVIEHNQIYNNSAVTKYGWAAGGGIYDSYNARVADNIIFDNTSLATTDGWGSGGGFSHVDIDGGNANTLIILNNYFYHNTAESINGLGVDGAVTTTNVHLTFAGNEITANIGITPAGHGGGLGGLSIIDPAEECKVSGNIFRENLGTFDGGAIILENNPITLPNPNMVLISDNYFINNEGTHGGAVKVTNIPALFQNNVFKGNHASKYGGAIFTQTTISYSYGHLVTLINNSFSGNDAAINGGAIYSIKAKPLIFNSIFYNDIATNGPEIFSNYPSDTVIIAFCNIDTNQIYGNGYIDDAGGNINADPLFTGTGENPLSLMEGSLCIDSGTPDTTGLNLPIWDIIGDFRLWDGDGDLDTIVDMGAYEYGSIPFDVGIPSINNSIHQQAYNIQSYPNPFSNFTMIEYTLEQDAYVKLTMFNYLGQQLALLVSGMQTEGTHQVQWNAEGVPAGIYFYRLTINDHRLMTAGRIVKY
jgi:predicted outer membrane repeat protein